MRSFHKKDAVKGAPHRQKLQELTRIAEKNIKNPDGSSARSASLTDSMRRHTHSHSEERERQRRCQIRGYGRSRSPLPQSCRSEIRLETRWARARRRVTPASRFDILAEQKA